MSMRLAVMMTLVCGAMGVAWAQESGQDLGQLSANPHQPNSTSSAGDPAGHRSGSTSVNNPGSRYGSPHSNQSATNPYATEAPRLYDSNGNYRGRLSANRYDPDSISNPFGRYGSKFSPDSINNHYGAGNPYDVENPGNPLGRGLRIVADDTAVGTTRDGPPRSDGQSDQQPRQSSPQSQGPEPAQESAEPAPTDGESTDSEATK